MSCPIRPEKCRAALHPRPPAALHPPRPSTTDAELATVADLKAEVARLDAKIDLIEARLDGKIDVLRADMNAGFERLEKVIAAKMRTQTIWMITTIVAVLGLAARTNIFG